VVDFLTCRSSDGSEEPVVDVGLAVRGEIEFGAQAVQVLHRLRADVVEVDQVADGVADGEEERRQGANLVELQVRVQGDVLVQRVLLHFGDEIPRHCQEEKAVAEREAGRGPSGDGDSSAHHVTQVQMLGQLGIV